MAPKKTPNGWQVRWRDNTGRQRAKTLRTKDKALTFERRTLVELQAGTWVDPDRGRLTVRAFSREWLAGAHNLRPATRDAYQRDLTRILPTIGDIPLNRVTDTKLDALLTGLLDRGLAPATVKHVHQTLRRMFRVAVDRGRLAKSPAATVLPPHVPDTEVTIITAADLEALAEEIDKPRPGRGPRGQTHPRRGRLSYRTLILTAGWGGPRWGELAGLKVHRVDVARNRIQVIEIVDTAGRNPHEPKTAAGRRWVSLPGSVMDELADHIDGRDPDDLVWTSPYGAPLRHNNWCRRYLQPACVTLGLGAWILNNPDDDPDDPAAKTHYEGLTPHDLRHTSVALAIADGAHPKAIQARLGHSSISVTLDRYGHLFPDLETDLATKLDDTRNRALTERRRLRVV